MGGGDNLDAFAGDTDNIVRISTTIDMSAKNDDGRHDLGAVQSRATYGVDSEGRIVWERTEMGAPGSPPKREEGWYEEPDTRPPLNEVNPQAAELLDDLGTRGYRSMTMRDVARTHIEQGQRISNSAPENVTAAQDTDITAGITTRYEAWGPK